MRAAIRRRIDERCTLSPAALMSLGEEQMKKKGHQRGTLVIRSGNWVIRYSDWKSKEDGSIKYSETSSVIGPATLSQRKARQLADVFMDKINGAAACPQGLATVEQFIDNRFRPEHYLQLKESGRIFYDSIIRRHVLPSLGNIQLKDVTFDLVQRLISAKSQRLSPQTVLHIRNVISAILKHARKLKMFQGEIPTEGTILPRLVRQERKAMSTEQVAALLAAMPEKHRPLMRFLVQTGLRIGEATGLRWKRVNLTSVAVLKDGLLIAPFSIVVIDSVVRGKFTTPKTARSVRTVPLSQPAIEALRTQAERYDDSPESPVFPGDRGAPLNSNNFQKRVVGKAAKAIGEPWITCHVARHTCATMLDAAGTSTAQKMALLGHTTEQASNIYTHPQMDILRAAMERISLQ